MRSQLLKAALLDLPCKISKTEIHKYEMQLSSPAVPGLKKAGCASIQCYKHKGLKGALNYIFGNTEHVSADMNKRHVSQLSSLERLNEQPSGISSKA